MQITDVQESLAGAFHSLTSPLNERAEKNLYSLIKDCLQSKIVKTNSSLEDAHLIVVLERHQFPADKQLFGFALGLLGSKEHDILLVERPYGFIEPGVFGWDHPKRDEWYLEMLQKNETIKNCGHILMHLPEHTLEVRQKAVADAVDLINKWKLPHEKNLICEDYSCMWQQTGELSEALKELQERYLALAEHIYSRRFAKLVSKTFQVRQEYLLRTLKEAQNQKNVRRIFVQMGKAHADQDFLEVCQEMPFVVLSN